MRIPSKRIRNDFIVKYELEGSRKAVSLLCKHYKIRNMRIVFNGRRAGNGNHACYYQNVAYFTRNGLCRKVVLHEFYHHLINCKKIVKLASAEEREADHYARQFLK